MKRLYQNVDFYFPQYAPARWASRSPRCSRCCSALARTVGWIAQWKEMIEDPHQKLFGRPRQLYTGAPRRDYQPISRRK